MFEKARPSRDAFTFSLGGMRTIASVVAPTAIADNRINQVRDDRLKEVRDDAVRQPRLWRRLRHQPA